MARKAFIFGTANKPLLHPIYVAGIFKIDKMMIKVKFALEERTKTELIKLFSTL